MFKSRSARGMAILLLVWSAFQLLQLDDGYFIMDGDDAQYILHARSLLVHHQYNDPNLLYRPGAITTAESAPPGWPVLLLPVVAAFGVRMIMLKLYVVLFAFFSGVFIYRILGRFTKDAIIRLLMTAAYYFSMSTIVFSRVVYSEWPYLLASVIALDIVLNKTGEGDSVWRWAIVGLCAGGAMLCRSVGVSLVLAVLAVLVQDLVTRRRAIRTVLAELFVFLASLLILYGGVNAAVKPKKAPGYKSQFLLRDIDFLEKGQATVKDIVQRVPENAKAFLKRIGPHTFGRYWHEGIEYRYPQHTKVVELLLMAVGFLLSVLFITGFIRECMKGPSLLEYYIVFYFAIMSVIWFRYEVYRYLMPVGPFLVLYMVQGLTFFSSLRGDRKRRWVVAFLVLVVMVNVLHSALEIYHYKYSSQNAKRTFRPYMNTVAWLKQRVRSDEIVIADEPRWYALETGLKVTTFLKSLDANKVMQDLEQMPTSMVVFDPKRRFQKICLVPVFQKYENRFRLMQQFDHIKIYRIKEKGR